MSKRSRRSETKVAQQATQPDARREPTSARVFKTLRSAEAVKLRANLLQVYNEATHETIRTQDRRSRPDKIRGAKNTPDRLHLPSVDAMSRQSLSPQVRDELLSGTRVLSCYRRNARKEVLFALRRVGKGKSGRNIRKARWTDKSYLRCK